MKFPALNPIRYARLVALWFALAVGASVASPFITPHAQTYVCTTLGIKAIEVDADGPGASVTLDCPACVSFAAAPPPSPQPSVRPVAPVTRIATHPDAVRAAVDDSPPPPSRGPPTP